MRCTCTQIYRQINACLCFLISMYEQHPNSNRQIQRMHCRRRRRRWPRCPEAAWFGSTASRPTSLSDLWDMKVVRELDEQLRPLGHDHRYLKELRLARFYSREAPKFSPFQIGVGLESMFFYTRKTEPFSSQIGRIFAS